MAKMGAQRPKKSIPLRAKLVLVAIASTATALTVCASSLAILGTKGAGWSAILTNSLVGFLAVIVSIGVSFCLHKLILAPYRRVVSGLEEIIESKDYSARIELDHVDEVGSLADLLNKVLAGIEKRDCELKLAGEDLAAALAAEVSTRASLQEVQQDLHQAVKRAHAASEAKSLFLAKMSHEIRTPMNGVLGMTEILLGTKLDDLQKDCAQTIEESAQNLLEIINDILDFSKAEAGKLNLKPEVFNLEELIGEVGAILAPAAAAKSIECNCGCSPDAPIQVRGDAGRIRQILHNLVGNAIKFTEQGQVCLDVSVIRNNGRHDELLFLVSDTGVGIWPEHKESIFESFSQADGSVSKKQRGTGLGLTIAKQLVTLMDGTLTVKSEVGTGSVFSVQIQLEVIAESKRRPELNKKNVLIATRRQDFGRRLSAAFEFHGSTAVWASNGIEAQTDLAEEAAFDYVIADVDLPLISGLQIAESIKNRPGANRPAVFLLTTAAQETPASEVARLGAAGMITTPVQTGKLLEAVLGRAARVPVVREVSSQGRFAADSPCVLIVEDNGINSKVAAHFLAKLGCRSSLATNGLEAIEKLETEHFDLVLMDVQMPVMDGHEATRRVRLSTSSVVRDVAIIAVTANAMPGEMESCFEAGMDDYMAKPISIDRLEEVLAKWLSKVALSAA